MDNVDITAGSSAHRPGLRLLVGSGDWAWLCRVRESEQAALTALQASTLCHPTAHGEKSAPASDLAPSCDDSKLRAKVERAAKAREARTERLEAVIAHAVKDHRAYLMAMPARKRAGWLLRQIEHKYRLRNEGREEYAAYTCIPSYRKVLDYLKVCTF